jgi:phosphopantothenoylcysteine synthetase/decarboxylase
VSARRPVLYLVVTAAPQALQAKDVIQRAQRLGWDACLICTPTAARWLSVDELASSTGHPVRSQYKLPGEPDVLPPPDAILVAPATANTIAKWALGISDNLALGLITEALGLPIPVAVVPSLSEAQAAHPAHAGHLATLRGAGVSVLADADAALDDLASSLPS